MTAVLTCVCSHEGQDKIHGAGKRVHNSCGSSKEGEKKVKQFRCTVCSRVSSPAGV